MASNTQGHRTGLGAYGSVSDRELPGGSTASWVKVAPNGMLMNTRELMAQPHASSSGARLRRRSFIAASSIDGVETSTSPNAIASGICHHASAHNPAAV